MKKYITTPIYYTNGAPHIGHAYTSILADVFKKFEQMRGNDVFLTTGTDEHGQKNQHSCEKSGLQIDEFLKIQSDHFKILFKQLNIDFDFFVRTSFPEHKAFVSKILSLLYDKGLIIKKSYEGLYCEGCEQFKKKADLDENGLCPDHKVAPSLVTEENYFFCLEPHRQWLKDYISTHPDWIYPQKYAKEVLKMLDEPLEDLCISRPKERVWLGIDLPFDKNFVTYIWFDALINYISSLKWGDNPNFDEFWKHSYHLIAKDILKPHCIYWPIMLRAIGIAPVEHYIIHGYWIGEGGVKMSKSLGNVVDPTEVIQLMGQEPLRFYLINNMTSSGDSPISIALLKQGYKQLANNLGNLQMRSLKMVEKNLQSTIPNVTSLPNEDMGLIQKISKDFTNIYQKDISLDVTIDLTNAIVDSGNAVNAYFASHEPWVLAKATNKKERFEQVIYTTLESLRLIAIALYPLMPKTSNSLLSSMGISCEKATADFQTMQLKSQKIIIPKPLFPMLEEKKN